MNHDKKRVAKAVAKKRAYNSRKQKEKRPPRTFTQRIGWFLDRLLYTLAPGTAVNRMATRHRYELLERKIESLKGRSFAAARDEEYRKGRWIVSRASPDSAAEEDLAELHDRCAEMVRNNTIANSAVESRVANEVGTGLIPKPMVKATEGVIMKEAAETFNEEIREIYRNWSRTGVDRSRIMSLPQFQKQVNRSFATYGEAFILFGVAPGRGHLELAMELITPERVSTPPDKHGDPNCVMGVQYDDEGQVVIGYHVRNRHPGDEQTVVGAHEWKFYPRYDDQGRPRIVHVFEPIFPGQSRGIPWMAASLNRMKDTDDMFEAELIVKQIESHLGVFITGGENSPSPHDRAEAAADDTLDDGTRIEEWYPGSVNYLEDGQEVKTVDPNRPGQTFAPFIEQSLRSIAAALNMPYEILAKNFIRVTYSSGRLAMLDGRLAFRMRTQTIKDMWLCHLHELVVHESIFRGIVSGDYIVQYKQRSYLFQRHDWRGRNVGIMDPEKERKGHRLGLQDSLDSRTSIKSEEGVDIDDIEQELLQEGKKEIQRQVELAVYRKQLEEENNLERGESIPASQAPANLPVDDPVVEQELVEVE